MKDLGAALGQLNDRDREVLELSLRRGMSDEEIAAGRSTDASEVALQRADVLDRLASDLGLDGREQRDELFATLQDLPPELWHGAS
jgi:DNA-directed RNA polymerase specialized sigma24 family protein